MILKILTSLVKSITNNSTMRYSLRNQNKISSTFSKAFLQRVLSSLDEAFKDNIFDVHEECKPYPILDINDNGHTCGLILFHVISKTFDVYNLAFKETVN